MKYINNKNKACIIVAVMGKVDVGEMGKNSAKYLFRSFA